MPAFSDLDGPQPASGLNGDRITFTHVNELRIWNYLDSNDEATQDCWLKVGEDFDGLELVHLKCSGVKELSVGTASIFKDLTLVSTETGSMELRSGEDFRVVCEWISFVE